jgi:hypothetical protein
MSDVVVIYIDLPYAPVLSVGLFVFVTLTGIALWKYLRRLV